MSLSEEEIFGQALEQTSPQERREFLQRVCRDDEQIARIEDLLIAGSPESSFLENGPKIVQESSDHRKEHPDRIGDFEILGELGRGGMGIVYKARQCSLKRLVALKVLSSGLALTTRAIMRFKLEAEAAAKLHHTNIVPIYSTGEENRVPYYAMELIDGPSLDQVIKQLRHEAAGKTNTYDSESTADEPMPAWIKETLAFRSQQPHELSPDTDKPSFDSSSSLGSDNTYFDNLAKMIAGVADALAHAHDHGIVHRDIKPANLLLSSDGRLSINDFGLARMLEQPGMTMTGELMGSPMYMSPEQITAGRLPLDHRTDIYSLGASLYELLTLHPPFPGQRRDQVLSQVIHKEPPRPRSINHRIPRDLETICMKAMEKDPDRRYQTADLLAEDLRRFVNRNAILARRTSPLEKGVRWIRKNKAITTSVCAALLVCLGSFVYVQVHQRAQLREETLNDALERAWSGRFAEADTQIDKAISYGADPQWRPMFNAMEDLMFGQTGDAVRQLETVVDGSPDNQIARWMLADAYWYNGEAGPTWHELQQLEAREPDSIWERLFAAQALGMHQPDRARKFLREALDENPQFTNARISLATLLVFQAIDSNEPDLVDEALEELERADLFLKERQEDGNLTLSFSRLYAHNTAAHFCRLAGDTQRANQHLTEAGKDALYLGEAHSDVVAANVMRMNYYFLIEDFDGMYSVMQDVKEYKHRGWVTDPFWVTCYTDPAWAHKEAKWRDADLFNLGLNTLSEMPVQKDDHVAFAQLVFRLDAAKSSEDATEMYRDYLRQRSNELPFDSAVMMLTGNESMATKQAQARIKKLKTEFARLGRKPDPTNAIYARLQYAAGEITKPEEFLERLAQSERDLVSARMGIGLRELSSGDRQAALAIWQEAASGTMYHWTPYHWSAAFAVRLKEDPEWLPWLPRREPVPVGASR